MSIAFTQLRHQLHGLVGVAIAIILGVAFVTTALLFGAVTERSAWNAVAAQYDGADVIVSSERIGLYDEQLAAVGSVPGVATAEGRQLLWVRVDAGSRMSYPAVVPVPSAPSLRDALTLDAGRLPAGSGEIALLADEANRLDVGVGDTITMSREDGPAELAIVGIVGLPTSVGGTGAPDAWLWPADAEAWFGSESFQSILITADPETTAAELTVAIPAALNDDVDARTRNEQARCEVERISGGTDILTFGLVAFAVVALFVAGLVIANTFAILVAQRTRTLALLRCVGATRAQIHRMVLQEAVAVGLVASVVGVLIGIAVLAAGIRVVAALGGTDIVGTGIPLSPVSVLAPIALGLIVTVVAASGPARGATRVAPLAALRPGAIERTVRRPSLLRAGIAAVLVGGGAVLLAGGVLLAQRSPGQAPVLLGVMGGMLSFLGIVVGAVLFVPRTVRALGTLVAPLAGPPAKIAAANSDRNPGRTAATATALLVAVTLVTMMIVGAASTRATLNRAIDERSPVDLTIATEGTSGPNGAYVLPPVPDSVADTLAADPDVRLTVAIRQADVQTETAYAQLIAIAPSRARELFRDPLQVEPLAPGTAVASESWALNAGVADGDTITLDGDDASLPVTLSVTAWSGNELLVTPADLDAVAPGTPTTQLWSRLDDGADPDAAVGRIQDRLASVPGLWFAGGAEEKANNGRILDTVLLVVTALLGVAVAIALVGVGNTLSLSVIERTRESAILRALGLTRRQLRGMLAIEGILLAVAGAALGIVLGTAYGLLGAQTLLGGSWLVVLSVPAGQLAAVVAVAVVAGLLASVLPARTAVRTPPVAALAE